MGKATKICTKCKRGLPETATKCSCGCTEILNKKDCDDILNKYHRSSEKEKYQMYQDIKVMYLFLLPFLNLSPHPKTYLNARSAVLPIYPKLLLLKKQVK